MRKYIFVITFVVLLLDQVIKTFVLQNSFLFPIVVIPSFFQLSFVTNTGAAFGAFSGVPWFIIGISIVFLVQCFFYFLRERDYSKLSVVGYGLFMGGFFGNLLDRIIHHFVIDYLDFTIFSYHFPVFNLADIAIVVGMVILILEMVWGEVHAFIGRQRKY